MPIFKNRTVLEFGGNVRLFFRVEVGLTGLEAVVNRLKSRLGIRTAPVEPVTRQLPADEARPAEEAAANRPFDFRAETHDEAVFQAVNTYDEYRLPDNFRADDIVVDIGAHIGSFCYAALRRGSNHVYGFEPEKGNYALAVRNLRPFGDRVHLYNKAVWRSDRKGDELYFARPYDKALTGAGNVSLANVGEEVETVAFDDVISEVTDGGKKRVRMLKIDCEGSEFPILLTSRSLHLIDNIHGEYHEFGGEYDPHSIPESARVPGFERYTIEELTEALQREGFKVTSVRTGRSNLGLFFATREPQTVSPTNHVPRGTFVSPAVANRTGTTHLCKVCDLPDWEDEEFQTILDELNISWAKERKHRKAWEFAQGIRGLKHFGALTPEAVAIGVGAGHEPPLYYLANHIREVHATDIYGSGVFAEGEGSAEMLTNPEKFATFPYRQDRLVVKYMDGCDLKYPDDSFDIAFSFSSVEHFGEDHRDASQAMREIARVLRPGGTAIITTEVILNDASHREFFRPEELYEYLVRPSGLELVEDIDFTISSSLLENPVDLDIDYENVFPHIVLRQGPVVWTSVIMFLQKPA